MIVARKQALPADQLDRLNERYRRERDALVALTNACTAVEQAASRVDDANDALQESPARAGRLPPGRGARRCGWRRRAERWPAERQDLTPRAPFAHEGRVRHSPSGAEQVRIRDGG